MDNENIKNESLIDEDIILFDWLSVTSFIDKPEFFIDFLGLDCIEFQVIHGFYGYKWRYYFDGISIHYDGKEDQGVLLEMSGQGCRVFETYGNGDWEKLFSRFTSDCYNITRLDVAYDDHTGTLDIEKIAELTEKNLYLSKATKWTVERSSDGTTVYIGSKKSETLIRFYDKGKERGYGDDVHWIRCELQLRRDRAQNFIKLDLPIGEKFGKVLNNYLRFVVENPKDPEHKHRWKTEQWWIDFVKTVEKISIYTKKTVDYNLSRLEWYLMKYCGNCIDTYIKCVGVDGLLDKLEHRESQLKERHRIIIENYKSGNA